MKNMKNLQQMAGKGLDKLNVLKMLKAKKEIGEKDKEKIVIKYATTWLGKTLNGDMIDMHEYSNNNFISIFANTIISGIDATAHRLLLIAVSEMAANVQANKAFRLVVWQYQ